MDIIVAISPELLKLGTTRSAVGDVMEYIETGVYEAWDAIDEAFQPKGLRPGYDIESSIMSSDTGSVELTTNNGALFWSFVKGSKPHMPPWKSPEHPDALPFPAALVVAEKGTPKHPKIDKILDEYEDIILNRGGDGLLEWYKAVL